MPKHLYSRNVGTLTEEEQDKIEATKIGIAGCGLGSDAGRALVRFGFDIGALADPDVVAIHNLNRQSYHHEHIDTNKAKALLHSLQHINPDISPKLYEEGINLENVVEFVASSDILIDAIDPGPTSIQFSIALTKEAHAQGKAVVTSIDFGFGSRLFVFPADGISIEEFMQIKENLTPEELLAIPTSEIMKSYCENVPQYAWDIIMKLESGELDYYPQNMLAVGVAGLMITAACKRLALGQPVITAPDYLHIDLDMLTGRI